MMKPDTQPDAEEDFWDLGDEDLDTRNDTPKKDDTPSDKAPGKKAPVPNSPKPAAKTEPEEDIEDSIDDDSAEEPGPIEDPVEAEAIAPADDLPAPETSSPENQDQAAGDTASVIKNKFSESISRLSLVEKISLSSVIIALLIVAGWGLSTYYEHAPEGTLVTFTEDFPVEGTHAAIDEIDTYWRQPIRKGENADRGVQLKARLIPCARIKLSGTGSASLSISFQDDEKELVGDPISLDVENGVFKKSGSAEIVINSTAGFENASAINAYTNEDINPWSLIIVEGAPGTNPSYQDIDHILAEVRVSPIVQEQE
ncbi:MAG: hypothetical protein ACSHYF_17130 [Verrucomicrobiaceae bacterium]